MLGQYLYHNFLLRHNDANVFVRSGRLRRSSSISVEEGFPLLPKACWCIHNGLVTITRLASARALASHGLRERGLLVGRRGMCCMSFLFFTVSYLAGCFDGPKLFLAVCIHHPLCSLHRAGRLAGHSFTIIFNQNC